MSGKLPPAKSYAFDLIVNMALCSTLASILLSEGGELADGVTALILLIALKFLVPTLSVRSARVADIVRSEPTLLLRQGTPLRDAMRKALLTQAELETVALTEGHDGLAGLAAVILESDDSFSLIDRARSGYAIP